MVYFLAKTWYGVVLFGHILSKKNCVVIVMYFLSKNWYHVVVLGNFLSIKKCTVFFYKNFIFWDEAQKFLRNPNFSLKKILVLDLLTGLRTS